MIKDYWERYKEVFYDGLGILAGCILAVTLVMVLVYGSAVIIERHAWVLWGELCVVIPGWIVLGIERLVRDLRG